MTKGRSREDERALAVMEQTAKRIQCEQRWEIGLLWRNTNAVLPESKSMAMMRLTCLERRLDRDNNLRVAYSTKIQDYIDKGYFVRVIKKDIVEGTSGICLTSLLLIQTNLVNCVLCCV